MARPTLSLDRLVLCSEHTQQPLASVGGAAARLEHKRPRQRLARSPAAPTGGGKKSEPPRRAGICVPPSACSRPLRAPARNNTQQQQRAAAIMSYLQLLLRPSKRNLMEVVTKLPNLGVGARVAPPHVRCHAQNARAHADTHDAWLK